MNKIIQSLVIVLIISFSLSTFLLPHAKATENFWTTKASMPKVRAGHGVAVVNGKIYAIGGMNGGQLNTNEEYDPATNMWATKKPMPTPRSLFGIAVVTVIVVAIVAIAGYLFLKRKKLGEGK